MSVERTYRCNLCNETSKSVVLKGVYFTYPHFEYRPSYDCESHLCEKCIQTIVNIENKDAVTVDADGFVNGMRPEGQ